MTVTSTTNKDSCTASAAQTIFPYTYRIFAETDLQVFVDDVLQTLTTDYTVTNVGVLTGGNVVFNTGLVGGEAVVKLRELPITQAIDYVENDSFPASSHEEGLDRAVMVLQDLKNLINQSLKLSESSTQTVPTLPDLIASRVLGANALNELEWQTDTIGLTVADLDWTSSDTTFNKVWRNIDAKELKDYKDVGHLPLSGGVMTGASTFGFNDTHSGDNTHSGTNLFTGPSNTFNNGIVIGTSGQGIDFSITSDSAGMTSELLDDYEEGTWTPALQGSAGSAGAVAYSVQVGTYTKIGRLVTVRGRITMSNLGSWSGDVSFTGLPFTTPANESPVNFWATGLVITAGDSLVGLLASVGTQIDVRYWTDGGGTVALDMSGLSATASLAFVASYEV